MTTTEWDTVTLVQGWVHYLRTGDETVLAEVFAEDHHDHVSGQHGREIYRTVNGWFAASFADRSFQVNGITTGEDLVMLWLTFQGRHIGNAFPMLAVRTAATGRLVQWPAVHVFRAGAGKLAEHWAIRDDRRLLEQLDA